MSDTEPPKTLSPHVIEKTAAAAFAPVLKIGGAISGFVAISYLIGLAYVKTYFATLGASWVVDLLSYAQIAKTGSPVATLVAFMAFTALVDHARTGADPKSIETWARYSALVGIVPAGISFLPKSVVSPQIASICMLAMGFFLTVSAGYTLAELIARFRQSNYKWTAHHLQLVFIIQVILLSSAPTIYGYSKAKLDMEGESLPTVEGAGLETGGPWRLVRSLDSGLLVVARTPQPAKSEYAFRFVPSESQVTISSTSRRGT
jgi:hypothetical protein